MASLTILTIFLLYIFFAGVTAQPFLLKKPDFSRYIKTNTLDVPVDRPTRILFVGDVHGRFDDLQDLLRKANYDPASGDVLVHTGDIITKGADPGSKKVLDWMAKHDISGVRGNNDQAVIDWKGWRDWISLTSAGKAWLHSLDREWEKANDETATNALDPDDWVRERRKSSPRKFRFWWRQVPEKWKMFREHYLIAASLEHHQYKYLLSLPLVIHIPSIHTFTAHAGILASDISRSATDRRQPLAHYPGPPRSLSPALNETTLRLWQESAILNDIPQNNVPWVVLNMRSISRGRTITRNNKGGPHWSRGYNEMMDRCVGFKADLGALAKGLPCMPASVVYGHVASRGLDINRWSFGLDTGCVYGRKLTALVLDLPRHRSFSTQQGEDDTEGSPLHDEDDTEETPLYDEDDTDEIPLHDEDDAEEPPLYDEDDTEETPFHNPTDGTQEVLARSQKHKVRFGDDGHLIKASIVDVDCSG